MEVIDIWEWPKACSLYSQLAGVLSGFVFASVLLLISSPPTKDHWTLQTARPVYVLLVSFFGLVISSFLFGYIAGYERIITHFIMNTIAAIASLIFALCFLQMFVAMTLIFHEYNLPREVISVSKLLFYGAAFLAWVFMITTFADISATKQTAPLADGDYGYMFLSSCVVFIAGGILYKKVSRWVSDVFFRVFVGVFVVFIILGGLFEVIAYLGLPHMNLTIIKCFLMVVLSLNIFIYICQIANARSA